MNDTSDSAKTIRDVFSNKRGKVTDKWAHYLDVYDRVLSPLRGSNLRILEVGVQNGGSLEAWATYFPAATEIVGCDIDRKCGQLQFVDSRLRVVVGDITLADTVARVDPANVGFDVVIDDGSHTSSDIVVTFCSLFPRLRQGGLYIIEDLHCSYWAEYGGGLFHPYAALTFLLNLVHVNNQEHWGVPRVGVDLLKGALGNYETSVSDDQLRHIERVEFSNSMCVIAKGQGPYSSQLGPRLAFGEQSDVVGVASLRELSVSDQSSNKWTLPLIPPAEAMEELKDRLDHVQLENARLSAELKAMRNSRSWRATALFRALSRRTGMDARYK